MIQVINVINLIAAIDAAARVSCFDSNRWGWVITHACAPHSHINYSDELRQWQATHINKVPNDFWNPPERK